MIATGIAVLALAPTAIVAADSICAPREVLLASLSREYTEAPKAIGLANNGAVVELLTAPDGGTWTILMTRPDGTSCVVAAGEAWDTLPQVAGGDGL
ncbi:hypothetical protein [Magnetospirillum sp. UT-4]|uniref:hypothetical protein n=1 Tax=Magnetospirillum sp. UT-4 TaxID=2681467 RepID=UPI00138512AC|nr:hypothetical protein [Magnetospirillum sp. UT-4]CAA7614166.1 conserved exported hypothetical protein [Magnetospirillum sp. UT-4]